MRKEIVIPIKLWLIELASIFILIVGSIAATFLIARRSTIKEIGTVNSEWFTISEKEQDISNFENKYKIFLSSDEKVQFIESLCKDFNINPDIVIAILEAENPLLNESAINLNTNGTIDVGFFQLNDRSLYMSGGFIEMWWAFSSIEDFDAFNWKHNTYIAIRYINDLKRTFGENPYWIAAGYNAGSSRAYASYCEDILGKKNTDEKLPKSTKEVYAPRVENNYKKWKNY